MYTRPLCCMSLTGLYVDVHACVSIGDHFPCPPAREQVHVQRAVLVRDVGGLDNGNRGEEIHPECVSVGWLLVRVRPVVGG